MIPLNENLGRLKRSAIRRFTNLANATPGCIKLTIGEPDFNTPESIRAAACAALQDNQTHYAPNQGTAQLRSAIADFESRRGMPCKAEQVLVTVGASGALFTALLGILNPGDEVIVPIPAFPLYESIVTMAGAKLVPMETASADFQITTEMLEAAVTEKTKAILLNSPNNPTGCVYTADSLAAVKRAVLGKPIFVICDNVYNQLSYGDCPDLSLDVELGEQLLLVQSFSKPYAMTGWRVGYLVGPEDVVSKLLLLHAAEVASVSTFLQTACVVALEADPSEMAAVYRSRRDYVCQRLDGMGLSYPAPMGAFYVFVDISRFFMDSETFCTRLIQEGGVAAVPGSCFGTEGFIRLSYCCAQEALEQGLDRLEAFIQKL